MYEHSRHLLQVAPVDRDCRNLVRLCAVRCSADGLRHAVGRHAPRMAEPLRDNATFVASLGSSDAAGTTPWATTSSSETTTLSGLAGARHRVPYRWTDLLRLDSVARDTIQPICELVSNAVPPAMVGSRTLLIPQTMSVGSMEHFKKARETRQKLTLGNFPFEPAAVTEHLDFGNHV
jgi:hypothetical protein